MSAKAKPNLLWVEVGEKYVAFRDGAKMPAPTNAYFSLFGSPTVSRKEFTRFTGVSFPYEGIFGLSCPMTVVEKYRQVVEKDYVAAERTTRKLVKEV